MRKLLVRHQPLPGIGELFELETDSGLTLTVISHRSGRKDVVIGGQHRAPVTAPLTPTEAAAMAALLTDAHVELTTSPAP